MKKISLLFLSYFLLLAYVDMVAAQPDKIKDKIMPEKNINIHQIIRIHYSGAVLPESLTVKQGSTVVWINESKSPVEIQFEGKQVTLACKNPVHFVLHEDGFFISDRIPTGAVASMCFIEPGEFSFVARKVPTSYSDSLSDRQRIKEFKGQVIVKGD
jgi:plastocyanin